MLGLGRLQLPPLLEPVHSNSVSIRLFMCGCLCVRGGRWVDKWDKAGCGVGKARPFSIGDGPCLYESESPARETIHIK